MRSAQPGRTRPDIRPHVLASGCFALASVSGGPVAVVWALVGAVCGIWALTQRVAVDNRHVEIAAAATLGLVGVVSLRSGLVRIPEIGSGQLALWLGSIGIIGIAVAVIRLRKRFVLPAVALAVVSFGIVVVTGLGVMAEHSGSDSGVDVYLSHLAASQAIDEGLNPYTDAVRLRDGSPFAAPGAMIEGYAYPPVTLLAYAGSNLLLGDPRWVSVGAWLGSLVALWVVLRPKRVGHVLMFGAAAIVSTRLVVYTGWTEPLTVGLLVAAVVVWRRPTASGVLLGLSLASKQYMVLLLPILLLQREWRSSRRTWIAITTAALTLVPHALWDFGAVFEALVTRPLGLAYRADAQSLPVLLDELGLSPTVPWWVLVPVFAAIAGYAGTRGPSRAQFVTGAALSIAVFFFMSLAFVNYWWIVSALFLSGGILELVDDETDGLRAEPHPT